MNDLNLSHLLFSDEKWFNRIENVTTIEDNIIWILFVCECDSFSTKEVAAVRPRIEEKKAQQIIIALNSKTTKENEWNRWEPAVN